jgi:enoyl-CoA hydratase
MMCDMIIAADNAKFAQPEIKLGIVPGSGGTQRLTRAVSKSKAMDLCLTGRMMNADEAERSGLVARVYPADQLMSETKAIAQTIATMPLLTLMMVKESVNAAFEMSLSDGIRFERRLFHACFGTEDQKEGMSAFLEKRPAQFKNR